jgi:imidazolonepropionase-like amidohydrolase
VLLQHRRSITLNPAEVFGLGDKLGSLDTGEIANVVICERRSAGCLDHREACYINGVAIAMQTRLRDEYWPKK